MTRKRASTAKRLALFLTAMAAPAVFPAFPPNAPARQNPVPFHPKFGMEVDSLENDAYRLFGTLRGFSVARLYQTGKKTYSLHILRNTPGGLHLLIRELSGSDGGDMLGRIREHVAAVDSGGNVPDRPVCPIDDPDTEEIHPARRIVLLDGSVIIGKFSSSRSDTLLVNTAGGLFFPIPDSSIGKVTDLPDSYAAGRWSAADPNQSRLFFAPTGRKLKPGSLYFADYYVIFPTLAAGVTEHFSVTGGVSLIPGADRQAYYLAPRWTFSVSEQTGVSTGFMALKIPEEKALTLAYAVGTHGDAGGSVTLGAGVPINRGSGKNIVLVAGGDVQVSGRMKLMTENWVITGSDGFGIFSAGVRFFGERLSVDLALITMQELISQNGFPFIPYIDFAVFFGR